MLAVLEGQLEKNRTASRKVPCSRTPRGSQYDVHSMHTAKHDAITSSPTKHPHPARRREPQNLRSSQADGSASVLISGDAGIGCQWRSCWVWLLLGRRV